jgi:hypothetical protein
MPHLPGDGEILHTIRAIPRGSCEERKGASVGSATRSMRFLCPLLLLLVSLTHGLAAQAFIHPGGLHTREDLDRMRTKVAAQEHPWIDGWNALTADRKARSDYKPAPHPHMASRQRAQDDATAAYLNAMRWAISGDKAHAACAARILNGWANTVKEVPHGPDQPGLGGIGIGSFAIAAEVLRDCPEWPAAEQDKFKRLLLDYFYPVCHEFLIRHNGAGDTNYWANWDTCNMRAILAIGVFCDDRAKFNEAVDYFKNGRGMGAIKNAVPFVYPGGIGQWQESGRDYAHTMGGMGLLVEMCQVAWNQGVDLFGQEDSRLLAGGEYSAQYTLWKGVPYTFYTNGNRAHQYYISSNYRGRLLASHFELLYNHYVVRRGLKAPNVQLFAEVRRPEPGEIDVFGYGTLTYTLDAKASPLPTAPPPVPRELRAMAGIGRVDLMWSPSGAYSAHGYEVFRAPAPEGPWVSVYSTNIWTTPAWTDTKVEPDKTYYYTVAALNHAGSSKPSSPVSARPASAGPPPPKWQTLSVAGATCSSAAGNSFIVPGSGSDLDGAFTGLAIEGDFNLTARLLDRTEPVAMMGLTVREEDPNSRRRLAMVLSEHGGRGARFRTRNAEGKFHTVGGNDYTWLPVWLRLQRSGDVISGWQSADGIEWFKVSETNMDLPNRTLIGLLVSAGDGSGGDSAKGIFDHVAVEQTLPAPPPAPRALKVTGAGDGIVRLDWQNDPQAKQDGVKVEASLDGAPFYEIADMDAKAVRFENTGIKNPAALRYRIRSYNRGGYSAYSDLVP